MEGFDVFDIISLFGGLALFLFGMNLMSSSLEKRAGGRLKALLGNITSNPVKGFLLGVGVTAVLQSSSATTVMVVGFVNSGLMTLGQSVGIIVGANLGASITPWLLSLAGIEGGGFILEIFKMSTITPIMAVVGAVLYIFQKKPAKRDTGMIFLGFAILMYGMETMSGAVVGLRDAPEFAHIISVLSNPLVGVLAGVVITAVIQSSSASIGILQALATTGHISYGTAIPVIMGQNIGTCISALLSCIGASKNAKRAAMVHLSFNVISTAVVLPLYYLVYYLFHMSFAGLAVSSWEIAMINTAYKIISIVILTPVLRFLEPLSHLIIRDSSQGGEETLLDERLLKSPAVAVARCRSVTVAMAEEAAQSIFDAIRELNSYDEETDEKIMRSEDHVDYYEDRLGTYLVKLSAQNLSAADNAQATKLLHMISDFERISDHAVNIVKSAEEIHEKKLAFSSDAMRELNTMIDAVSEIMSLALASFRDDDLNSAVMVEPLKLVVDNLKDRIRLNHVKRMQQGECTIELGFILTDLLTNLERVSDHCSNIAGYMLEMSEDNTNIGVHEFLHNVRSGDTKEFNDYYDYFKVKYRMPEHA